MSAVRSFAGGLVTLAFALGTGCSGDGSEARPSPTMPAFCGVSELLVPDCGAWFGATTPSADGEYDYARGLDEYESVVGSTPDILHFYRTGGAPFPDAQHVALAERPGHQRSILFFSWKPDPSLTWRQIADGAADAAIGSVADGLNAYPRRFFLTVHHEPENEVQSAVGSGMTTADYVDMYRHVTSRLRTLGVDHAVFVMTYMGFERWAPIVDELYPGDDVVDWVAYDPYGFAAHDSFRALLNSPGDGWPGFYKWVTAKAPDKPVMVAEWGFDLSTQPDAARALEHAPETLSDEFPAIRAIVYWNDHNTHIDARLLRDDPAAVEFAAAFTRLARDPLFGLTPTDRAP